MSNVRKEGKVGVVILLCGEHEDDEEFKRDVLCDEELVRIIKEKDAMVWGADVRSREGYQGGSSSCNAYNSRSNALDYHLPIDHIRLAPPSAELVFLAQAIHHHAYSRPTKHHHLRIIHNSNPHHVRPTPRHALPQSTETRTTHPRRSSSLAGRTRSSVQRS